jgi:hypothetical protein
MDIPYCRMAIPASSAAHRPGVRAPWLTPELPPGRNRQNANVAWVLNLDEGTSWQHSTSCAEARSGTTGRVFNWCARTVPFLATPTRQTSSSVRFRGLAEWRLRCESRLWRDRGYSPLKSPGGIVRDPSFGSGMVPSSNNCPTIEQTISEPGASRIHSPVCEDRVPGQCRAGFLRAVTHRDHEIPAQPRPFVRLRPA